MDRDTLLEAARAGAICISMNDGRRYVVPSIDHLIVDDIAATAGSLTEAARVIAANGAREIYAAVAHPVLSGPAVERILQSPLKKFFVSDSIPVGVSPEENKLEIVSVAPLFGEAIRRIHENESVSSLFD